MKKLVLSGLLVFFALTIFAQPTISLFNPLSGPVGTSVTITGTNFSTTPANNIVYFGAVKANVISSTSTSITTSVPHGTTYQPISITVNGLTGYSTKPFIVTFSGANSTFSISSFANKIDSTTGIYPQSTCMGDINGDGKPDLLTANLNSNSISVLINTSTNSVISFATKIDFPTITRPTSISLGDLDGDGKLDIALSNDNSIVTSLKNTSSNSTISFTSQATYFIFGSKCTRIGDFNADGKPDLAVASDNSSVIILPNTSSGSAITFGSTTTLSTGSFGCTEVAVGDLNGDGKPDLVSANYGYVNSLGPTGTTISVFINTNSTNIISFTQRTDFTTERAPYNVAIGDFDTDGKNDIVVTNGDFYNQGFPKIISIFRNTSNNGFVSFANKIDYNMDPSPNNVSINDLDGDGKLDIAISNGFQISVLKNISTVGVISLLTKVDYTTGIGSGLSVLGDLNSDGKPDIAVANNNDNSISILKNNVGVVLPLTLLSFKGKFLNNQLDLEWATINEINTAYFQIESSVDGRSYNNIGSVIAKGYLLQANYNFKHSIPNLESCFYRLKMVDKDGSFAYSEIIKINSSKKINFTITPNPANNFITITNDGLQQVSILDVDGKLIYQNNRFTANKIIIDISRWTNGTYFIKLYGKFRETQIEKILIQH